MSNVKQQEQFLRSHLRAMNLWFVAGDLREMKQEEWKLSTAGVKLDYFRKLEEGFKKTFRFNLYDAQHEVQWQKPLDDFMHTLLSFDEMFDLIQAYVLENEALI